MKLLLGGFSVDPEWIAVVGILATNIFAWGYFIGTTKTKIADIEKQLVMIWKLINKVNGGG